MTISGITSCCLPCPHCGCASGRQHGGRQRENEVGQAQWPPECSMRLGMAVCASWWPRRKLFRPPSYLPPVDAACTKPTCGLVYAAGFTWLALHTFQGVTLQLSLPLGGRKHARI